MAWQTILTGIGAILTGAGGCFLVITEFRRRDRQAMKNQASEMSVDVAELRDDLLACRRYSYHLAALLADADIEHPKPPPLRSDHL